MGMFEVKVKLANLAAPDRTEEVSLLVDTGATLSWIPREILQKLGVTAFSRLPFSLADGRVLNATLRRSYLPLMEEKLLCQLLSGSQVKRQSLVRRLSRFWVSRWIQSQRN